MFNSDYLQVSAADGHRLSAAQPPSELFVMQGMNHVLRQAPADRSANLATYSNPNLPLAAGLVETTAGFLRSR